jgi:hypothetical protein
MPILIPADRREALTRHTRPILRSSLHSNIVRGRIRHRPGFLLLLRTTGGTAAAAWLAVCDVCCCCCCDLQPLKYICRLPQLVAALHKKGDEMAQTVAAMVRGLGNGTAGVAAMGQVM